MPQSSTPDDLFNPGAASAFFSVPGLQEFEPRSTREFSRTNSLWLAEFSRLIYRQGVDELKQKALNPSRAEILAASGDWRESEFFLRRDTQSAFFTNERLQCACLVFRGTLGFMDMVTDAQLLAVPWQGRGRVHLGFKSALDSVWSAIEERLRTMEWPVFFAGHSLGGALATLAAARVLQNPALQSPAAVYTFGSPRVGDEVFGRTFDNLFHCRVVNDTDVVPTVPPAFSLPLFPVYRHTGEMHRLLPGGVMETYPNGFDVRGTRGPAAGIFDFTQNVRNLFKRAQAGGNIPQSLLDHAPVNYVSRLAEVAPTQG